jgi:hypothetical protein
MNRNTTWVYKLSWKQSALLWFGGTLIFIVLMWLLKRAVKNGDDDFSKLFKKNRSVISMDKVPTESKGETACRRICEEIFGRPFKKIRPDWLKNNVTGYNLELDIYNEELGLAVEYNGKQHYEFSKHFHNNNKAEFRNQQYRDEIKRMLCKENNIKLIEIPHTVKLEDLESFIRMKCIELGVATTRFDDENEEDDPDDYEE